MITFAEHQVRAGKAGAPGDFEQMLGLLVRATSGQDARLVFANPGDWGIDVLIGSLNGRVTVWQAKYFAQGIGRTQRAQIESSFATVVAKAAEHGFTLERWVLCAPASMDTRTRQWWDKWKQTQERATGAIIGLWDENVLRELLLRKEAAAVYEEYYGARDIGGRGPVNVTATAARDAFAAGRDLTIEARESTWTNRVLVALSGAVAVIVLVTVGTLLLVSHHASGADPAIRTPHAWAGQVNAVCRRMNPKLVADLKRINAFPPSAFESTPLAPGVPAAINQLDSDYEQTAALVQDVPEPSVQNAAVNDWLTAWANRNVTLNKVDNDINGVNSDLFDRVTSFYEIEKFVSETDSMRPLAVQVGVSECV